MDITLLIIAFIVFLILAVVIILWIQNRRAMQDLQPPAPLPFQAPDHVSEQYEPLEVETETGEEDLAKAGAEGIPVEDLERMVLIMIRLGQQAEAIQFYRAAAQVSLAEAKNAILILQSGGPLPIPGSMDDSTDYSQSQNAIEAQIQPLLERGLKINAIKLYREVTGAGLKEAKDAVEAMERGEALPVYSHGEAISGPADLEAQIIILLRLGQKIQAIKLYRQATGAGLKEAKEAVEALERGR